MILYDCLLYIFRVVRYEIPIWGGRARGQIARVGATPSEDEGGRRAGKSTGVEDESGRMGGDGIVDGVIVGDGIRDGKSSRGVRRLVAEEEMSMRGR